jgi:hypothetical protein
MCTGRKAWQVLRLCKAELRRGEGCHGTRSQGSDSTGTNWMPECQRCGPCTDELNYIPFQYTIASSSPTCHPVQVHMPGWRVSTSQSCCPRTLPQSSMLRAS